MKRAMSLLLTLAMVMSFFTVGAFATGETFSVALDTGCVNEIVVGGTTTLKATTVTYTPNENYNYAETPTYSWEVKKGGTESTGLTKSATGNTVVLTGAEAGDYTVTCTATVAVTNKSTEQGAEDPEDITATAETTIKVVADNYEMKFTGEATAAETMKLAPKGTGTVTVDAKLYSKADGTTDPETGVTYALKSDKTSVATVSGTTVTAVAKGTANIYVEASYKGQTYKKTVCTVTVADLGLSKSMPNGSYVTYPATATGSFAAAIAADLKSATGAETAPTISALTLTVPSSSIFTAYNGEKKDADKLAAGVKTLDMTKALIIASTAGSVATEEWTYTATVGGIDYTGKLTLKSDYADTYKDYQTADFTKEWFYLESVGNSIIYIRDYVSGATSYPTDPVRVTYHRIDPPTSYATDWTEHLIGYDNNKVAYLVDVDFTAASYDILTYTEDGDTPFEFEDFSAFVESVAYEQDYYYDYYDVALDTVKFGTAYETNKWELKDGSSRLSTSTKLTSTELEAVTIDVKAAGIYDIPFTAYYDYKTSSSDRWSTSPRSYAGVVTVYATADGDIEYEVSYSDSVTFDVSDFQSFYKTAAGSNSAKLKYVDFDGQPLYGYLYSEPNRYTSGYMVDSTDRFYADPTSIQLDLDYVTYVAESTPKTQYSVYIPFTANGTSGNKTGVVEIIVNGELPFVDISTTHTFYDYIKYVYNNDIMNGKTATRFDASSPVTRIQLVTTLYRMAGSPSTYNSRKIAFTDSTKLSTEFSNALKWATATGMVNGYGDLFKPNDAVTRQAMVTILYRFANYYGYDTTVYSYNNLASFKDAAKVSASMKEAMNWAVDCGFVSGNGGKLNPGGSTTRGACAKILAGFHDWYIG